MKNFLKITGKYFTTIVLMLLSIGAMAQNHMTFSVSNCAQTGNNTMTVDLYMINDGTASMRLNSVQFGINVGTVNLNGGVLSWALTGTSDLLSYYTDALNVTYNTTLRQLQLNTGTGAVIYSIAQTIDIGVPVKVGSFTITNTHDFPDGTSTSGWTLQSTSGGSNKQTGAVMWPTPSPLVNFYTPNSNADLSMDCSLDFSLCPKPAAPGIGTRTQPSCGVNTGSVNLTGLPAGSWTVTASPGGAEYYGSGTPAVISGLAASTTYTFTVVDESGCGSSNSSVNCVINAVKVVPDAPVVDNAVSPSCGVNTGSASLSGLPSGSWTVTRTPGGTQTTTGSGTTGTFPSLPANNTYTFTVKNSDLCTSAASSTSAVIGPTLTVPGAPSVFSVTDPACGTPTGSVVLKSLPASGNWTVTSVPSTGNTNSSGTQITIPSLTASTTYNFYVTNASGCTSVASPNAVVGAVKVTPGVPSVGSITQPTCAVPTGSVALSNLPSSGDWTVNVSSGSIATGGTGTGGGSTTVTGISVGTRTFTVSNSDGCTSGSSGNAVIIAATTPSAPGLGTITQSSCVLATGSVVLNGLPATGSWTVNSDHGGYSINGTNTSSGTVTGLNGTTSADVYTFAVTQSGCTSPASNNVAIGAAKVTPGLPVVGTVGQPTCSTPTGSAALSNLPATGNWTVHPSSGASTAGTGANSTIGGLAINATFTFTVTNSDGCTSGSSSGSAVIGSAGSAPPQPTVNSGAILQPTCGIPFGTITFNAQSNVQYGVQTSVYNGGSTLYQDGLSFPNLPAGIYTLSVRATSDHSCISFAATSLTITAAAGAPPTPIVTLIQPTCAVTTGSIVFNAQSGVEYNIGSGWTSNRTFSGLGAGNYIPTVRRTSDNTCTASASQVSLDAATTNKAGTPSIQVSQQTDCSHPTATIVVDNLDPDLTYTINNGASFTTTGIFTGLTGGSYTVIAKFINDPTACISDPSSPAVVSAAPGTAPAITINHPDTSICNKKNPLISFKSSLSLTSWSWSMAVVSGTINTTGIAMSGASNSTQFTISGVLNNIGTETAVVTYTAIASKTTTAGVCQSSAVATVRVYPIVKISDATADAASICSGTNAVITINGDDGMTFTWASSSGANISGGSACVDANHTGICGSTIDQTLSNTGLVAAKNNYTIMPWLNGCSGGTVLKAITVQPVTSANVVSNLTPICNAQTSAIQLSSTVAGTTYKFWGGEINPPAGGHISGFNLSSAPKSGSKIAQKLTNDGFSIGTVLYSITPSIGGCSGNVIQASVDVNAVAGGSATTTADTIVTGTSTDIVLNGNGVAGMVFNWAPKAAVVDVDGPSTCSDIALGCGFTTITDVLNNTSGSGGSLTPPKDLKQIYAITTYVNGCKGSGFGHTVMIRPTPIATTTNAEFCNGGKTKISLNAKPAGCTFTYTSTVSVPATNGEITGNRSATDVKGYIIDTLRNTGESAGVVDYTITPTYNGSVGESIHLLLTVQPVAKGAATPDLIGICGDGATPTGIVLHETVPGLTNTYFKWTIARNANVTGAPAGGGLGYQDGTVINDLPLIINPTLTTTTITYTITPYVSVCPGTPFTRAITLQNTSAVPATPNIYTAQAAGICPDPETYEFSVTNVPPYGSISWGLPAGATTTGTLNDNPIVVKFPGGFTSGNITATSFNACNHPSAVTRTLAVSSSGGFSISGKSYGVCGASNLAYSVVYYAGHSYSWSATSGINITGGATTNAMTADFDSPFTSGTITCTITGCTASPEVVNFIVQGIPSAPSSISGPANHCADGVYTYTANMPAQSTASSFVWTLPPGATAIDAPSLVTATNAIQVTYAGSSNGLMTVKAMACALSSATRNLNTFVTTTGCRTAGTPDQITASNTVAVYPNPAHDKLNVVFNSNTASNYVIRLVDITGRTVLNQVKSALEGTNVLELDLTSYAKGIYNLSITTDEGSKQIRLTVE